MKIKNSIFPPKHEKSVKDEDVLLKKLYKFTSDHFLIGEAVFVLFVKTL